MPLMILGGDTDGDLLLAAAAAARAWPVVLNVMVAPNFRSMEVPAELLDSTELSRSWRRRTLFGLGT